MQPQALAAWFPPARRISEPGQQPHVPPSEPVQVSIPAKTSIDSKLALYAQPELCVFWWSILISVEIPAMPAIPDASRISKVL